MRNQQMMATPASRLQLSYVHHWRRRGYRFSAGTKIPLSTVTPPVQSSGRLRRALDIACILLCVAGGLAVAPVIGAFVRGLFHH